MLLSCTSEPPALLRAACQHHDVLRLHQPTQSCDAHPGIPAPPKASRLLAHSQQKAPQGTELRAGRGCSIPKPPCVPAYRKLRSRGPESVPLGCPRDIRWKRNEPGGGTSPGVLLVTGSTQALGLRVLPALCLCSLQILHRDKSKRIFTCPAARLWLVSCSECLGLRPRPQTPCLLPLQPHPELEPRQQTPAPPPAAALSPGLACSGWSHSLKQGHLVPVTTQNIFAPKIW